MIVTIKRVLWSGDTEMVNKIITKQPGQTELKTSIDKQIKEKLEIINVSTAKYNESVKTLKTINKIKKETIKYLKTEVKDMGNILKKYNKELITLVAIREEQE